MQWDDTELDDETTILDHVDENSSPILFTLFKPRLFQSVRRLRSRVNFLEDLLTTCAPPPEEDKSEEEDQDEYSLEQEEELYSQIPWTELLVMNKYLPDVDEITGIKKYIELGKNINAVIDFFRNK